MSLFYRTCETTVQEMETVMQKREAADPDCQLNMVEQLIREPGLTHKDVVTFMVDLLPGGTETVRNSIASKMKIS